MIYNDNGYKMRIQRLKLIDVHSLRFKILVLIALILLVIMLTGRLVLEPVMKKQGLESLAREQMNLALGLAENLDLMYHQGEVSLTGMAAILEPFDPAADSAAMNERLTTWNHISPQFNYCFIVDTEGRWLSYPDRPGLVGQFIPGENIGWVRKTLAENRTLYTGVHKARTGALVSGFATPLHDSQGEVTALLRGVILLSGENTAGGIVRSLPVQGGGEAFVVDDKGWLLAHPALDLVYSDYQIYDWSALPPVKKVLAGESGMVTYNREGKTWLATYTPVLKTGWGVVVQRPAEHLSRQIRSHYNFMAVVSLTAFLLIFVLVNLALHFSMNPLFVLSKAIKNNQLDGLDFKNRKDEIGTVSHELLSLYNHLLDRNRELELARQRAEESDRLKSSFLANISHEIRTPLNGIMGFVDLLKDPRLDKTDKDEYLGIILSSGERLLGIINDLINISRIDSGEKTLNPVPVNAATLIREVHAFFHPEAQRRGLALETDIQEEKMIPWIKTDQEKLRQILINLTKNALKFTPQGRVTLGCRPAETGVLFFVRDTGIGIKPGEQEHIFERFRQGSNTGNDIFDGAGLGLAISRGYAEWLGGQLTLVSQEGEGSLFELHIPAG
jgi:signal transduction histidine kinase